MNDVFSSLKDLSFLTNLTPEISAAIENIFQQTSLGSALSALDSLSGIPLHPYDNLKHDLYGPEYKGIKFKTLDEIPAPANFVPEEMLLSVNNKVKTLQQKLLENLDNTPELFTNTILNTVSGDKIIPNIDTHKKHIEFIELIKQIPVDAKLSNEQILDYSKKIISEFIKTY